MLSKYRALLLITVCCFVAPCLGAESSRVHTKGINVAVVNINLAFERACISLDLKNKLSEMEKELSVKAKATEQKLAKLESELSKRRNYSKRKEAALKQDIASYQALMQKERARITRIAQKGSQKILSKICEVTKAYATEHGLKLVLPADFAIFFSPVIDVTEAVILKLNLESSKINLHEFDLLLEREKTKN